jgi:hypothetical protein
MSASCRSQHCQASGNCICRSEVSKHPWTWTSGRSQKCPWTTPRWTSSVIHVVKLVIFLAEQCEIRRLLVESGFPPCRSFTSLVRHFVAEAMTGLAECIPLLSTSNGGILIMKVWDDDPDTRHPPVCKRLQNQFWKSDEF